MTKKDLFNEWERQEPLELDKEKLGTAFSKVLKKIYYCPLKLFDSTKN